MSKFQKRPYSLITLKSMLLTIQKKSVKILAISIVLHGIQKPPGYWNNVSPELKCLKCDGEEQNTTELMRKECILRRISKMRLRRLGQTPRVGGSE